MQEFGLRQQYAPHLYLKADSHRNMENKKNHPIKANSTASRAEEKDLTLKLQELEIQKEKLEEAIKAREEQLLNLFSYIEATAK